MRIKIDHIAKIEGHAGFVADIVDGKTAKARLNVLEGARLLEGILQGRSFSEVSQIAARICGVCPVVHTLTSIKALEDGMKISPSKQTILLRELMMMGQILNSHALHLFFFSLADFFGIKDDLKLIKKYPNHAKDALIIRDFGNEIIEVIGGRSIHPLTAEVGGFKKLPDEKKLKALFQKSEQALVSAQNLAKFFSRLSYPEFERPCRFVSLSLTHQYPIYDGLMNIGGIDKKTVKDFMTEIKENQVSYNPAVKRSFYGDEPYMVGALARLNNNGKFLNPKAKEIFKDADLIVPINNPFYNIFAQAIEITHCVEEAQKLLNQLKDHGLEKEEKKISVKTGEGWGAIEAPRGTLFYYYEIDKNGLIKNANIITPTAQNLARLELDLSQYLPKIISRKNMICGQDCQNLIKMMVRAYDPCLTCATH